LRVTFDKDEVELTETSVIIRRRNISSQMAVGVSGDREIGLSGITATQLKPGGFLPGFLVISYAGSKPFNGGWVEASQDPDAFVFRKSENGAMAAFKTAMDEGIKRCRAAAVTPENDVAGSLERLASLVREGILTPDEFTQAKAKILSQ
jgi:hypothetical protein